jgi:prepilin-type N-terminal cleavage/methylation domain-containing protein
VSTVTLNNNGRRTSSEAGFSLLEMIVAISLLTGGLLAVASSIGYALMVSNSGRTITNSKLLIVSVLEQMETLRNTQTLTYGQISNEGLVDNSGADWNFVGFPAEFLAVSTNPGPDGIFGTRDDLVDAGVDGRYGTSDDFTNQQLARVGVSRQILITELSPTLKRIQVTLRYAPQGGKTRDLVGVSYLNDDAKSNYVR